MIKNLYRAQNIKNMRIFPSLFKPITYRIHSNKKSTEKKIEKKNIVGLSGMFSHLEHCLYCQGHKYIKCLECDGIGKYLKDGGKEYICRSCYGQGHRMCVYCGSTGKNHML